MDFSISLSGEMSETIKKEWFVWFTAAVLDQYFFFQPLQALYLLSEDIHVVWM